MTLSRIRLSSGVLKLVALAFAFAVALTVATPAQAQRSADDAYGNPINRDRDIDRFVFDEDEDGGTPSSGRTPLIGTSPSSGSAPLVGTASSGRTPAVGVLPATGGPLPVILLAGLALAGTGMLVLRRFSGAIPRL